MEKIAAMILHDVAGVEVEADDEHRAVGLRSQVLFQLVESVEGFDICAQLPYHLTRCHLRQPDVIDLKTDIRKRVGDKIPTRDFSIVGLSCHAIEIPGSAFPVAIDVVVHQLEEVVGFCLVRSVFPFMYRLQKRFVRRPFARTGGHNGFVRESCLWMVPAGEEGQAGEEEKG